MNEIAKAISEGFKLIKTILDTREIRRYKAAVDSAEDYIFETEKIKPNEKLLKKYKDRFFKYNQG